MGSELKDMLSQEIKENEPDFWPFFLELQALLRPHVRPKEPLQEIGILAESSPATSFTISSLPVSVDSTSDNSTRKRRSSPTILEAEIPSKIRPIASPTVEDDACTPDNIIEPNDPDTPDSAEATREEHTKSMIKQLIQLTLGLFQTDIAMVRWPKGFQESWLDLET